MNSLYNETGSLSADFVPSQPGSKFLKSDIGGPYPGGVPYLTSSDTQNANVNMTSGNNVNGTIKNTITTRTKDQDLLNIHQLAFVDAENSDKPILRSLQSVNSMLASKAFHDTSRNSADRFDKNSKEKIMDRFKFVGVVTNNDTDNKMSQFQDRQARAFTLTSWGATHVLDYWSTSKRILSGYDSCYLILKQVLVVKDLHNCHADVKKQIPVDYQTYNFQLELSNAARATSSGVNAVFFTTAEDHRMIWQFVPFFNSDAQLSASDYSFRDVDNKLRLGAYIKIGNVHEYPTPTTRTVLMKRNETSVARDVVYLHENGLVKPMQFYVFKDAGNNLV